MIAWGVLVPLLMYFLGPNLQQFMPAGSASAMADGWAAQAGAVWRYIVRPIAVGGMMVGAAYTLFNMRKNLTSSLGRAFGELRHGTPPMHTLARTERYMSSKTVFVFIAVTFALMIALYIYFSGNVMAGVVAAVVMLIVGFIFATVSGNLVGMIGSSNNPISGLTLSTLIIAALLMVALGVSGMKGVAVVLGVAAVVCVSSAVAGELLQDFKAGYILGGTPRTIQIVELIAVVLASLVMYFPLYVLQVANIKSGGTGFGDKALPAPQAGLMAALAQGIVGGEMAWPLVIAGALFGVGLILLKVRSPMLVAVGMYLPLPTTFAIFLGGMVRGLGNWLGTRAGHNEAQKIRTESVGVLIASGLIAGEALTGLLFATFRFRDIKIPRDFRGAVVSCGIRGARGARIYDGPVTICKCGETGRSCASGSDDVDGSRGASCPACSVGSRADVSAGNEASAVGKAETTLGSAGLAARATSSAPEHFIGEHAQVVDDVIRRCVFECFRLKSPRHAAGLDVRVARGFDIHRAISDHYRQAAIGVGFLDQLFNADRMRLLFLETIAAVDAEKMFG